ncbi:MAG TPA: hypothetical protein VGD58_31545 [Herpetosiphonaceae bacterium]
MRAPTGGANRTVAVRSEASALEDATAALFVRPPTPGVIRGYAAVVRLPPALQIGAFLAGLLITAPFVVR